MITKSMITKSILLLIVALTSPVLAQTPKVDAQWKIFRKAYPYHVQGIAISPMNHGKRSLIIAEPPPHVTIDSLKAIDQTIFAAPQVKQYSIGYDGWVKDVVVPLDKIDPSQLTVLMDKLHVYLFGTSYKAYVLKIPQRPLSVRNKAVDLQVNAADLNRWLYKDKELFAPLYGGQSQSVELILREGRSGMYYSRTPGLVALVVPKTLPLNDVRRYLREFAIDSDLILGATDSKSHVAIIARERVVSPDVLPPLRTETILLLAAAEESELAQSYERNNFWARQIEDLNADWAPIYLSDLLIDTEYGSLLNITDQLLKSWSMGGQIQYRGFTYPQPERWPFPMPIMLDARLQEVTFNWNTKGAGYAVLVDDKKIFALNRTGSLPVSYIPGEIDETGKNPLSSYEAKGYNYFSGVADVNLARVVQYAALYQIFREYGIHADIGATTIEHPEWRFLAELGNWTLQLIERTSPETFDEPHRGDLKEIQNLLQKAQVMFGKELKDAITARLANPRVDEKLFQSLENGELREASISHAQRKALVANIIAQKIQRSGILKALDEMTRGSEIVYAKFAAKAGERNSKWIRTPSIVISNAHEKLQKEARRAFRMTEDSYVMGGHNLDSRIVRYEINALIKPGNVQVIKRDGAAVVQISERDLDKVPSLLRATALTRTEENLPNVLQRELATSVPRPSNLPRTKVLKLGNSVLDNNIRGLKDTNGTHVQMLGGWNLRPSDTSLEIPASFSAHSITIQKVEPLSFSVLLSDGNRSVTALSYDATMDLIAGLMKNVEGPAGPWNVNLKGFSRSEAYNFLRTAEVQFAAKDRLQLTGFSIPKNMSTEHTFKTLSKSYDFSKARFIDAVQEEGLVSGRPGMTAVRATFEVPAIAAGKPSLFLRIRLFFRSTVSEPIRQAVQKAVTRILHRSVEAAQQSPLTESMIAEKILVQIKRDLKSLQLAEAKHLDIEIEVNADFGDFYVAGLRVNHNAG